MPFIYVLSGDQAHTSYRRAPGTAYDLFGVKYGPLAT